MTVTKKGGAARALAAAALAVLLALGALPCSRQAASADFSDISGEPSAIQSAIDFAVSRGWMEGYEDGTFRPLEDVSRADAARGLVYAFGHSAEETDPSITFPDLPPSDPRYRWANLAVKHGLLDTMPDGRFAPDDGVIYARLAIGVTHGLGMDAVAANVTAISPGAPYYGGSMVVFHDLHLKYYERSYAFRVSIWPRGGYPRGNFAYTLQKLAGLEPWRKDYLRNTFTAERCVLPQARDLQQTAVSYAFERLGQPYLYGGETEKEGGFDCSGFVYNTLNIRMGYPMMRVADDQARDERYLYVKREALQPGDAIFWYDEEGGGSTGYVGHAGMYVGNGLFIHSTGSNAGVSLDCLDTNSYWGSHFAWGRRVVGGPYPNRFDEYLLLSNPGGEDARVSVEYLRKQEQPLVREYYVAAGSRATVSVDDLLPYDEVSMHVTSDQGIVAERAMYYNYGGLYPGGDASIGMPRVSTGWFLAEGYTGPGFHTWLLMSNPSDYLARVKVSYLREEGEPLEQEYELLPRSRSTVYVNQVPGLGSTGVSVLAESLNGVGFVAERAMYFDFYGRKGGSGGVGLAELSTQWFLAEGYTGAGFDTWLLLANPGEETAQVEVDFLLEGKSRVTRPLEVPPRSRYTLHVNGEVPPGNVSTRVTSTNGVPLAAERAMYFDYRGRKGGHASAGSTLAWYEWNFAEGYTAGSFDTWLLLANPGDEEARVTCSFMLEGGGSVRREYRVPPGSRFTVPVDEIPGLESAAFATQVTSDRPVVAERAVYFDYRGWDGGSDSRGVTTPQREWHFAEGYTGG
jgi:hypothetical protein